MDADWIANTWRALVTESGVPDATTVLFVVTVEHDLNGVEAAYVPPSGYPSDYQLFALAANELHETRGLHRFVLHRVVRDGPLGGFAAMLRHELRHAEQDMQWGGGLWELDGHLRSALDFRTHAGGRDAYKAIPTEADANWVAATYVFAHHEQDLEELAEDERFEVYGEINGPPPEVLEATLAAVEEHVDLAQVWNEEPLAVDVAAQYQRARQWAARDRGQDRFHPTRGDRPGVVFM